MVSLLHKLETRIKTEKNKNQTNKKKRNMRV